MGVDFLKSIFFLTGGKIKKSFKY